MEIQLYKALIEAGVSADTAASVVDKIDKEISDRLNEKATALATKADLQELKADLIKWNVATILAAVGLALAIAKTILHP